MVFSFRQSNLFRGRSLWRIQVLAPVLVVVLIWCVMSIGTTYYLKWLEVFYDRVFSENLTSIGAAHSIESLAWRTLAEWGDTSHDNEQFGTRWNERKSRLKSLAALSGLCAHTKEEKLTQSELHLSVDEICRAIETELNISRTTGERNDASRRRIQELADKVSSCASQLRIINEKLIADSRTQLAGTHALVQLTRIFMLTMGPIVGVYLGWRVARRLQSSVTEIAVTLNASDSIGESQDLKVSISNQSSFEDVRRQAERVVERLRAVGLELQYARREVIQSERLAAVGELAAGVAHELRNPLTSVKLLLQHASRHPSDFKISESQLALILNEIRRMESTIQGLLDFSRTPALHRVRHDLRETLRRSLNLVDGRLRQHRLELVTSISSQPIWVDGDAEQLNQVFVNLLLNSIEAVPDDGRLDVSAEFSADSQRARVVVQDTGTGIAKDVMARLFEPFATTKERGTGLGLAISRRIVTEHQGTITAENLPDRGAVFTIELPLATASISLEG